MSSDHKQHEHWSGTKNRIIRYYFYCQRGIDIFNSFRYVIMAIFGVYYASHLHSPILIPIIFLVSIPVLTIAGWYSVHNIGKVIDWLTIKFSTHYGRYNIELLEGLLAELKDLRCHIKKNRKER